MYANTIMLSATTALFLVILCRLSLGVNPCCRSFRLMERGCLALAGLHLWNWAMAPFQLQLGINGVTLLTAGFLGLPGIAVMAAVKAL